MEEIVHTSIVTISYVPCSIILLLAEVMLLNHIMSVHNMCGVMSICFCLLKLFFILHQLMLQMYNVAKDNNGVLTISWGVNS